jgi:hypothetical protein
MDLDGYSRRAEAFTSELAREHYRRFAGLTDDDGIAAVYARHAELFTRRKIDELRSGSSARRRALLRFAVEGHLAHGTVELEAELWQREAHASVEVGRADGAGGRHMRMGYRDAALEQAREDDPERRAELDQARRAVAREQLAPVAAESLARRRELTVALGWPSYRALYEQTTGVDLGALSAQANALLHDGEQQYRAAIDAMAREVVPEGLAGLRRADLPWLLGRESPGDRFVAGGLVPALHATLADLGIDPHRQRGLVLDATGRPGKSARAFCVAVRVPGEVYLVVPPRGGHEDYFALMHEAGHAQHFAGTDPRLPFELRRLGDPAVGEAFAFLFEGLVGHQSWLRRHIGVADAGDLARHATVRRMILVRRYAAKLGYELELHGERSLPATALSEAYSARLSEALGFPWPTDTWLTDLDPGLYVAGYLRAWALEAGLRHALREDLGEDWFAQQRAGSVLGGLWRQGQRLSAEELLDRVQPGARLDLAALAGAT